ncbi:MAG: hypothetical protein O2901_08615 [Verrucomicrobia bacterium]|nr:hypothetical protein [Verrucomicrobiota bacterium]
MIDEPSSIRRAPFRRLAQLVAVVSIAASVALFWRDLQQTPDTRFDDAYMVMRYVHNALAGHGLAWNPGGPQVLGTTSVLHFGALSAARTALPELADAEVLKLFSAVAGLLTVFLIIVGCARAARSELLRGAYLVWGGILCPLLLFNGMFRYHCATGMDTTLSMACNALLIGTALRMAQSGGVRWIAPTVIVGYIAYLARPDSGIYVALFPALSILSIGPPEGRARRIITFWVAMGGVLIADALAKWVIFGDPFPLSFYMKTHAFKQGYAGLPDWNTASYFMRFMGNLLPFIGAGIILGNARNSRLLVPFVIPFALTMAYCFTTVQVMGFRARFFFPSLPFVVMAVALLLDDQTSNGEYTFPVYPTLARVTLTLLLVAGMPLGAYTFTTRYAERFLKPIPPVDTTRYFTAQAQAPLRTLEWWDSIVEAAEIAGKLPAESSFALTELGLVGASAPDVTIIDPTGLHDSHFAHHGFTADEFLNRKPDLIWMPHPHYISMLQSLLESQRFWDEYEVYAEMLNFGMAVRKQSPRYVQITGILQAAWAETYEGIPMRDFIATRKR